MDASAYLLNHGWRGEGHSLDTTDRGIRKPLLVSKKVDVLGVGLNKHAAVSDQWWLRAFDEGLKNLGSGKESALARVQKHGVTRGGLYGRFVKGEGYPGSIESTGHHTPVANEEEAEDKMGKVDIPPEDKLERVVGKVENEHQHAAMMHLLQNPKDAPAGMHKMLDRKRKRAERPAEKRARRKTERTHEANEARIENRHKAIAAGTWDAEAEEEKKKMRRINRQADEFVLEAQRRGFIPLGPNEIKRGIQLHATGANATAQFTTAVPDSGPTDAMTQIFAQSGLTIQASDKPTGSSKNSLKTQKYAREKMKRDLKRAAKAYLTGEKPLHEQTREEKRAKKAEKQAKTAAKRLDEAKEEAEKMVRKEEREKRKRERRAERKKEKEAVGRILREREEAEKMGVSVEEYQKLKAEREAIEDVEMEDARESEEDEESDDGSGSESGPDSGSEGGIELDAEEDETSASSAEAPTSDEGVPVSALTKDNTIATNGTATTANGFEAGTDHIRFGMNRKGGKKKIPGIGSVERYPTKAEKKAKKLKAMAIKEGVTEEDIKARVKAGQDAKIAEEREKVDKYRAMKHGMTLEQYQEAIKKGEVQTPRVDKKDLSPEKLAEYRERAEEKGISLEKYIQRREEKAAAKLGVKLGNPFQTDMRSAAEGGAEYLVTEEPEQQLQQEQSAAPEANELGFVMDTTGDESLVKHTSAAFSKPSFLGDNGRPLAMMDTTGNETFTLQPNMPIPLDPRVWEGQEVKHLPKLVRKARKEWMLKQREEKKARAIELGKVQPPKKPKGQRKVEAREAFVKQVLWHSRNALRHPNSAPADNMLTIDGVTNVPLVIVESREGPFKKHEVGLARTVARRVLRNVKREEKAKKGKGKGWKKRERAEIERKRNAGISGFTDRARLDESWGAARGNRDLLL